MTVPLAHDGLVAAVVIPSMNLPTATVPWSVVAPAGLGESRPRPRFPSKPTSTPLQPPVRAAIDREPAGVGVGGGRPGQGARPR